MNPSLSKPLSQSSTFRWAVSAGAAYLVQRYGIPALPVDVLGEFTNLVGLGVDLAVAWCLGMAVRGRVKAREIIDGWM
jgi:hypothetical protein